MTEQEQKELALFKEWWKTLNIPDDSIGYALKSIAEAGWFARTKLDKDKDNEKD